MLIVFLSSLLLIALTTLMHYEVLRGLHARLPASSIPHRSRLLVVVFATFASHVAQVVLYGLAMYLLVNYAEVGKLDAPDGPSLASCMYFSAEAYTSLGFGDIKPTGPIRLVVGIEALNGLLLIGWSASYMYIAMERFWEAARKGHSR
jgi:glucose-6-phosphate-specific signal transduction histidine kinase